MIVGPLCQPELWLEGLAYAHVFKHNLLNCERVYLSRFVVDLTAKAPQRKLSAFLGAFHTREHESKQLTTSSGALHLKPRPCKAANWLCVLLTLFPNTCSLTSPLMSFAACRDFDSVFTLLSD